MLPLIAFAGTLLYYSTKEKQNQCGLIESRINNGYQFRDVTFDTMADYIKHPDVVNNNFVGSEKLCNDRGVFGIPREYKQLYNNLSQITVLHRTDSLYL